MPLPSYMKDSVKALDSVIKTSTNPYVVGIGGVISTLVEVTSLIRSIYLASDELDHLLGT